MHVVERRVFSETDKAEVVEDYRASGETQKAYAARVGLTQSTVSRWVREEESRRAAKAPEMLQVVPVGTGQRAAPDLFDVEAISGPSPVVGARLHLGGGVELFFACVPSPAWVAALAAELRGC
ncbi:MAG: helix-turn-helix domain-containing protein [Pseudomonadota bacterium]|nr:helix-turn-helix domain-containing protein [Pseudomonadota bacterium]